MSSSSSCNIRVRRCLLPMALLALFATLTSSPGLSAPDVCGQHFCRLAVPLFIWKCLILLATLITMIDFVAWDAVLEVENDRLRERIAGLKKTSVERRARCWSRFEVIWRVFMSLSMIKTFHAMDAVLENYYLQLISVVSCYFASIGMTVVIIGKFAKENYWLESDNYWLRRELETLEELEDGDEYEVIHNPFRSLFSHRN